MYTNSPIYFDIYYSNSVCYILFLFLDELSEPEPNPQRSERNPNQISKRLKSLIPKLKI
ncbi:hypothetical protein YC2023_075530 [Brassica napus]